MGTRREQGDHGIVDELREKAAAVTELERQLETLEEERNRLRTSTRKLSRKIEELREAHDEWQWFFEHSLEMLCIAGMDGYFQRVNPAFARTLGYSVEELLSRPFVDFVHPDDVKMTVRELEKLGEGCDSVSFENRYRDAEGNWRWILWHCPAKPSDTDKLYAIARDITMNKQREADILYKASHDPLTTLPNRAAFEERLEQAITRHARFPEHQVAVYLLDLDGFKEINDTHGHPTGDRVLIEIAQRFKQLKRENEQVCRFGGDEFAFMLEGISNFELEPLALRIVEAVQAPIDLGLVTVNVDCSIGIATFPEPAKDAHTLMALADAAMYHVKHATKGGFHIMQTVPPELHEKPSQA